MTMFKPIQSAELSGPRSQSSRKDKPDAVSKKKNRQNVSVACRACKQRRIKCSGEHPCQTCARNQVQCLYIEGCDARRRPLRKRKNEELQNDSNLLTELIQSIQETDGNDDHVDKLVSLIRNDNPATTDIKSKIKQQITAARSMTREEGSREQKKDLGQESSSFLRSELQQHDTLPIPLVGRRDRVVSYKQETNQPEASQPIGRLLQRGYPVPGYTRTFGNLSFSNSILTNGYPTNVKARQLRNFHAPEYLVSPLIDFDESPLSRALTDFQQMGRRLIAEGTPATRVSDQGLVDVTLFFRDRLPEDPVNASTWASEMLKAFRGTLSDQLLLACAVTVASLMRWMLMPTLENYMTLPDIARPTKLQRLKPHPAWVDLMVFPSFRDALVSNLRDWVEPCIEAKWDIMWPYSLEEALVHHTPTKRIFLTQDFATYAANPKNWIMQRSILNKFPEVDGTEINIAHT